MVTVSALAVALAGESRSHILRRQGGDHIRRQLGVDVVVFAELHDEPDQDQRHAENSGADAADAAGFDLALDLAQHRDHQKDEARENEHAHHGYIDQPQNDVLHDYPFSSVRKAVLASGMPDQVHQVRLPRRYLQWPAINPARATPGRPPAWVRTRWIWAASLRWHRQPPSGLPCGWRTWRRPRPFRRC